MSVAPFPVAAETLITSSSNFFKSFPVAPVIAPKSAIAWSKSLIVANAPFIAPVNAAMPAVSEWGLAVMVAVLLGVGAFVIARRQRPLAA